MDLNAKEKARELADMVGSLVVDENLPLEVMEMAADLLKEDCKEIRQARKCHKRKCKRHRKGVYIIYRLKW